MQALRRQGGALSSAELQTALGVSQPTVSRALAPLIQAGEVQKVGAARKQRYVLPRTVRDAARHVLVKFSPAGDAPTDQRMRDLLVCEHLALQTLASAGIAAAASRISTGAGRVFLEVERFDRTPINAANPQALALARSFWAVASADVRISTGFRQIAAENLSHMGR